MNKKIAKKWSKALRSRKYKKGTNSLCQVDDKGKKTHCCLGVLCELYQKEIGDLSVVEKIDGIFTYIAYSGQGYVLPKKVMVWAGMKSNSGMFDGKECTDLAHLNDDLYANRPFYKIAEIIDNNWEKL